MAIGIVDSNAFEEELRILSHGRGNKKEVPMPLRKLIAQEAIEGASGKLLSGVFGVSESSVSAYKNGATSTASYNDPDNDLLKANNEVKKDISEKARGKLIEAMEHITGDKLKDAKVRDLASVAKDLSGVMQSMEPAVLVQNNQQVIIYRPRMKEEDEYDIVEAVNE